MERELKLRFAYGDHRRAIFTGKDRQCCYPCKWMCLVSLGLAIIRGCLRSKFLAIFASDSCLLLQYSMIMNKNNPQYMRVKYDSKTEIFCNFSVCEKDFNFFFTSKPDRLTRNKRDMWKSSLIHWFFKHVVFKIGLLESYRPYCSWT